MKLCIRTALAVFTLALWPTAQAAEDIVIGDFEGADYGSWAATGEAFGPGPAHGTLPGQMPVDGFKGKGLVNSFYHGDGTKGTLTSPKFKVERRFIRFLIGGGKDLEKTAMHLVIDGKNVRSATGPNDRSGGSEALIPDHWDVQELIGQEANIEIVDQATGGWGHINVDEIVQTNQKPPGLLTDVRRDFQIQKRYLNLPVKNGRTKKVTLLVDGRKEVQNDIGLADGEPDWWAFMDVSAWRGNIVTLDVDKLMEDSKALSSIYQSDEIPGAEKVYKEPLRAQFHFSPRRGWNNDPNGLAYYKGEYHLFFQHNPYGWNWGNMHWGHAVSRDLLHWQELGDVLAPDSFGPMFSGSAVVDEQNTSGLGRDGQAPLVLFYTAAGNPTVQCMAYSTDGRHFTKFEGNPVVPQFTGGNRDPKVIWHKPSAKWIMTLYVETNKVHTIHFLSSSNLKDWTLMSRVEGFFECPDFFELPVDGDPAHNKWVLTAASSEYMVGTFDGRTFTPETAKLAGHRGAGFYAAQTYSDIPPADGRRIQIGWFQTETKGMPFNQGMTIPLELRLLGTAEGPRLTWTPVRELDQLRTNSWTSKNLSLKPGEKQSLGRGGELLEVRAEINPHSAKQVTFNVRGAHIGYDAAKQEIVVNGHRAPAPLRDGKQRVTIFCDRTSLEVFASDGLTYVPMPYIARAENRSVDVESEGGEAELADVAVYNLQSVW